MDIVGLRREAATLLASAEELNELAVSEDREVTTDEQAQIDQLVEKAGVIEGHLAAYDRAQALSANKTKIEELRGRFNTRMTTQDRLTKTAPLVTSLRPLWEDDPKKGYQNHRGFLLDVLRASTGGRESAQLQYLRVRAAVGSDEHSTFNDPFGGYLLPIAFSPEMLKIDPEMDPTMGRVTQMPMEVATVQIAARVDKNHTTSVSGGLRVYRRAEADTVTPTRMELERITLHANALMGVSFATEELLTDSPMSFIAILQAGFSDEFDSRILDERLNGTGVGEFLGVNNSPAVIAVSRMVPNEVNYEDVVAMRARAWKYQNAVWLANHDVLPQLAVLNLVVGAGGSAIYLQNATMDMPDTLMGRPIFYTEYVKSLGTAGDMLLVNWSQYLEGTYQPLQSAESIHVRFVNNERAFRFTMRNDGAPWWRSALQPKNSAHTLSPYVALAA